MKMRILVNLFFITLSFWGFGQPANKKTDIIGEPKNLYPTIVLVIDTSKIILDSISSQKINPKWLKKIEVFKNEKYKLMYGNQDGVIFLYTKKRFNKKMLNELGIKQ